MANVYTVKTFFYWGGIGGEEWNTALEMAFDAADLDSPATNEDDITPEDFVFADGWEQPIITFFRTLMLTSVYIDRIVVSTWAPDTRATDDAIETYGATELKTVPVGLYGLRDFNFTNPPSDLETTLFARKLVGSGRLGRLNLRGVLLLSDIETNTQARNQLRPGSPVAPGGELWATAVAALAPYFSERESNTALRFVMFGGDDNGGVDGNLRSVRTFQVAGVKNLQLRKKRKPKTVQAQAQALLKAVGGDVLKAQELLTS